MGRDDDGVELEQRRRRGGLVGEHVEAGAGDAPVADGPGQRLLVDDAAPRRVDDAQAGLGLASRSLPIRPDGLGRLGQVDGEEVGRRTSSSRPRSSTPIWRARSAETNGSYAARRMPNASARCATSAPDPAEPDDAEDLAVQLDALPPDRSHLPAVEGGVGLGDVAGLGQQQGHGVLGRREDVGLRRVDHHHAAAGGGSHVDVVEADAGPAHHHEVGAGLEHLGRHLGRGADDEGVGAGHHLEQLGRRQAQPLVDLVPGLAQPRQATLGQLLGHQDPAHRPMVAHLGDGSGEVPGSARSGTPAAYTFSGDRNGWSKPERRC